MLKNISVIVFKQVFSALCVFDSGKNTRCRENVLLIKADIVSRIILTRQVKLIRDQRTGFEIQLKKEHSAFGANVKKYGC